MKKLNKIETDKNKCPHCKGELKEVGIGYSIYSECLYKINVGHEDTGIDYELDETLNGENGTFYCRSCGRVLDLTDDEVIEILADKTY